MKLEERGGSSFGKTKKGPNSFNLQVSNSEQQPPKQKLSTCIAKQPAKTCQTAQPANHKPKPVSTTTTKSQNPVNQIP